MGLAYLAKIHAGSGILIIAIVGPESSGKTSLAESLAGEFSVPWLPEYARQYLAGRPEYSEADLEEIGRGQLARESAFIAANPDFVVLDTDLIVISVWWHDRFGHVPAWVKGHLDRQPPRHYLLTRPDLPWEPDPLRVSPLDRERLFGLYRELLSDRGFRFHEIYGQGAARLERAVSAVAGSR